MHAAESIPGSNRQICFSFSPSRIQFNHRPTILIDVFLVTKITPHPGNCIIARLLLPFACVKYRYTTKFFFDCSLSLSRGNCVYTDWVGHLYYWSAHTFFPWTIIINSPISSIYPSIVTTHSVVSNRKRIFFLAFPRDFIFWNDLASSDPIFVHNSPFFIFLPENQCISTNRLIIVLLLFLTVCVYVSAWLILTPCLSIYPVCRNVYLSAESSGELWQNYEPRCCFLCTSRVHPAHLPSSAYSLTTNNHQSPPSQPPRNSTPTI